MNAPKFLVYIGFLYLKLASVIVGNRCGNWAFRRSRRYLDAKDVPIVAVSGFVLVSSIGKPRIIVDIITASFNPPNCSSVASRKTQKNNSDVEMSSYKKERA